MPKSEEGLAGRPVTIKGWVKTIRTQKAYSLIEVNDGSTMAGLQVVAPADKVPGYAETVAAISTGAAIGVVGTIKESPGKGQKYEVGGQARG
jgi:asparaginyl-tRNA synthetase